MTQGRAKAQETPWISKIPYLVEVPYPFSVTRAPFVVHPSEARKDRGADGDAFNGNTDTMPPPDPADTKKPATTAAQTTKPKKRKLLTRNHGTKV